MSYIRKKAIAGLKRGDCFAVSRTFTRRLSANLPFQRV